MKNKKQTAISDRGIKFSNIIFSLAFVILILSLSCFPVKAEGTEEEKFITVRMGEGGDIAEDLPVKVYRNSEDVRAFNDLPDSVDLSTDKYFPPIRNQ